jgi:hypothetical protein
MKSAAQNKDDTKPTEFASKEGKAEEEPYLEIELKEPYVPLSSPEGEFVTLPEYKGAVVQWAGEPTHNEIMKNACKQAGFPEIAENVALSAPEPDTWYYAPGPLNEVFHSEHHYWDPYWVIGNIPGVGWFSGQAPQDCQKYSDPAIKLRVLGDISGSNKYLGWSSHFLTDVGNPMHAGEGIRQYILEIEGNKVHKNYEDFVALNWGGKETWDFSSGISTNAYWYSIKTPNNGVKNLARYTNGFLTRLLEETIKGSDSIKKNYVVKKITERCILKTEQSSIGLVRYVMKDG